MRPTSRTRSPGSAGSASTCTASGAASASSCAACSRSIPSFDSLGLPMSVRRLAENPRGLVLVTGPTGSGKTTTLAAMIDHINSTMSRHIVTVEDPIEVLHADKQSIVNQREVGTDTADFGAGAAPGAAPGPRRHPHRRDARRGDGRDRAVGGRDRSPRLLDAAHDQRDRDDQPDHRLLPAAPAAPDPHGRRRLAARHREPAARRDAQRRRAGARGRGARGDAAACSTRS